MAARKPIQIYCGPNGSARPGRIDALLRESAGAARLLVPSVRQARLRRERYLSAEGCPGAWGAPAISLTDFAHQLVAREGVAVTRFDSPFEQRLLMEHCLAEVAVDLDTPLVRIQRTPGLIRHLVMVVNDLKQAAIEPADFQARIEAAGPGSILDEGVAAVYALYQEALLDQGLYDVPGLYWHADYFATQGRPRLLDGVTALLWDGFDDFTPSEFRLLRSLSAHVARVVVGLNLDLAPDRQDRYALSLNTLRALREAFDCQVVECEPPEARSYVDFAARHIFWREEPALPEGLNANLAILPCSDTVHELETIARRVKGLVVEAGVLPEQIAVVYWNIAGVAGALRTVFEAFGIPCQISTQCPLAETGLGRMLVNLFCNTARWEREGILDLLLSPYLRRALWGDGGSDREVETEVGGDTVGHAVTKTAGTAVPRSPHAESERRAQGGTGVPPVIPRREALLAGACEAAAYHTRHAQILEGYKNWTYRLDRLKKQLERGERRDAKSLLDRRPDAIAEIEGLLAAAERLRVLQQRLPAKGTQHDYAATLDTMLGEFALDPAGMRGLDPVAADALQGIRELLELLAGAPGSDVVDMGREDFLARFAQGMEEMACTVRGTPGGVWCLDAGQVRNQRYDYVFAAGLNEGRVPAPPAGNAVYPEGDRERLQEAGIPIDSNQEHHARQRMLFGHVLECAETSLVLSWQLMQDSGREASPSPFLTDVRELFPEAAGVVAPYPRADSFLPAIAWLASPRDVANRALYDMPALAGAFPEWCGPCLDGVAVEQERHSEADFGPFDAALGDPALVAAIAAHYGEGHEFSVNQLETYLSCPFRFYMDRILHLEDLEQPDGTVSPLLRGGVLHEVLQRFHGQFAGLHIRDIGLGKAEEAMEALVHEVFETYDWGASSAPRGAVAAEKLNLLNRMRRYLRIEHGREEEQRWKPRYFEVAFGRTLNEEEEPPSTADPYAMDTAGGPIRFTGRIDRIDRDGDDARIIDYKSGGTPGSGEITGGDSIQLSVYAGAVEHHLLPGSACTEAYYLSVGKTERREALGIGQTRFNWPDRADNMKAAIERAVDGIRRGYFPPIRAGKSCFGCGHARACRHEAARIARKMGE